jgi:hypothetical protein
VPLKCEENALRVSPSGRNHFGCLRANLPRGRGQSRRALVQSSRHPHRPRKAVPRNRGHCSARHARGRPGRGRARSRGPRARAARARPKGSRRGAGCPSAWRDPARRRLRRPVARAASPYVRSSGTGRACDECAATAPRTCSCSWIGTRGDATLGFARGMPGPGAKRPSASGAKFDEHAPLAGVSRQVRVARPSCLRRRRRRTTAVGRREAAAPPSPVPTIPSERPTHAGR